MNATVLCVVLAAGSATRLGHSKTSLEFGAVTFLERALAASAAYRTIVVTAPGDDGAKLTAERYGAAVVTNSMPERGMSHSLRLANAAIDEPDAALAVLLVDTPLVDSDVLKRVISASDSADVTHPVDASGRAGHPVLLGPRARAGLDALPDGDTLRLLRDDPRLSRIAVPFEDERPFTDVDTPADLERVIASSAARAIHDRSSNIASPNE